MRLLTSLVVALALAAATNLRASDEDTFIKAGGIYYAWAAKDAPRPFANSNSGDGSTATLKIIQYGTNQWYWVEFDEYHFPPNQNAAVTIYKKRRWVNFAQVTAVVPGEETNYSATYPQGFKIVPYDGLGP
jgi:hypothetical protein